MLFFVCLLGGFSLVAGVLSHALIKFIPLIRERLDDSRSDAFMNNEFSKIKYKVQGVFRTGNTAGGAAARILPR